MELIDKHESAGTNPGWIGRYCAEISMDKRRRNLRDTLYIEVLRDAPS